MPAVQDHVTTGSQTEPEARRRRATRVIVFSTIGFTLFFAAWVMLAIVGLPSRDEFGFTDSQFADLPNGFFFILLLFAGTASAWLHLTAVRIVRKGSRHLAQESEHGEQPVEAR